MGNRGKDVRSKQLFEVKLRLVDNLTKAFSVIGGFRSVFYSHMSVGVLFVKSVGLSFVLKSFVRCR